MEHKMRLIIFILCCSYVCCQVAEVKTSAKSINGNIDETRKLITNSKKTDKRDSSDQTSVTQQLRDEPFKPIYRPLYYSNLGFHPTVNTYEAAAAASPQAYYEKRSEASSQNHAVAEKEPYPRPYTPSYKEAEQQQQQQAYLQAEQSQATPSNVADAGGQQQPENNNIVYERVPLSNLHYHPMQAFMLAPRQRVAPLAAPQPAQYVIAIPLSYARLLQQQLSHVPMQASQAYALPAAMSPHQAQPAATQSLAYRPFQYALPQNHGALMHVEPTGEPTAAGQRFIQIPSSMIYAAAQASTIQEQRPATYQPNYYQQAQPIYQTPTVAAGAAQEIPHPQSIYAYQLQVPQTKPQQQPPQHAQYVQIGGGKSALKSLGYYMQSTTSNQHEQQQQQQQEQHQQQQPAVGAPNPYANYVHGPTPLSLLRISAPRALVTPHYLHMQSPAQQLYVRPTEGLTQKLSYATHPYSGVGASYSIVPPSVPYLSQPGAVHYGSHLYHPSLQLPTQPTKADFDNTITSHGNNPTTTHHGNHHNHHHHHKVQPQQSHSTQQQQHQHQQKDNLKQKEASSETSVVKYP